MVNEGRNIEDNLIDGLLQDYSSGKISRRDLIKKISAMTAVLGAIGAGTQTAAADCAVKSGCTEDDGFGFDDLYGAMKAKEISDAVITSPEKTFDEAILSDPMRWKRVIVERLVNCRVDIVEVDGGKGKLEIRAYESDGKDREVFKHGQHQAWFRGTDDNGYDFKNRGFKHIKAGNDINDRSALEDKIYGEGVPNVEHPGLDPGANRRAKIQANIGNHAKPASSGQGQYNIGTLIDGEDLLYFAMKQKIQLEELRARMHAVVDFIIDLERHTDSTGAKCFTRDTIDEISRVACHLDFNPKKHVHSSHDYY